METGIHIYSKSIIKFLLVEHDNPHNYRMMIQVIDIKERKVARKRRTFALKQTLSFQTQPRLVEEQSNALKPD